MPTPIGGGSGRLIFELPREGYAAEFRDLRGELNVFVANADGTGLAPVTDGWRDYNYLEDVSPDGGRALIASTSKELFHGDSRPILYSVNLRLPGSKPVEITSGFNGSYGNWSVARWIDSSRFIYIGWEAAGYGIYTANADGTGIQSVYKYKNDGLEHKPAALLAVSSTRAYWFSNVDTNLGGNIYRSQDFIWWSSLHGTNQGALEFQGKQLSTIDLHVFPLVISVDASNIAWVEPAGLTMHHNTLHLAALSAMDRSVQLEIASPWLLTRWWPDGSRLFVFDAGSVSGQFGGIQDRTSAVYGVYKVTSNGEPTVENLGLSDDTMYLRPKLSGAAAQEAGSSFDTAGQIMDLMSLSPDGGDVIALLPCQLEITVVKAPNGIGIQHTESKDCRGSLKVLDLSSGQFSDLLPNLPRATNIHWLP